MILHIAFRETPDHHYVLSAALRAPPQITWKSGIIDAKQLAGVLGAILGTGAAILAMGKGGGKADGKSDGGAFRREGGKAPLYC